MEAIAAKARHILMPPVRRRRKRTVLPRVTGYLAGGNMRGDRVENTGGMGDDVY